MKIGKIKKKLEYFKNFLSKKIALLSTPLVPKKTAFTWHVAKNAVESLFLSQKYLGF